MKNRVWTWVGSKLAGTSHVRVGRACDDFAACMEIQTNYGSVMLIIASDGAGSAEYSHIGARIVVSQLTRNIARFVRRGEFIGHISMDVAENWLDDIRNYIYTVCDRTDRSPRDYAATLVAAIAAPTETIVLHVGDGAAVIKNELDLDWIVPSWPMHGEYASTTYFVTDDIRPNLHRFEINERAESIAVFTDGIERLVLDFATRTPHQPFFKGMIEPLKKEETGRSRKLSKRLAEYLDSDKINSRTDDDKTLILAHRILG